MTPPSSTSTEPEDKSLGGSSSLAQVALKLFDEFGYDSVTTEQIAAAAGVTQRTFFRHFATKIEVLMSGARERQGKFIERLYGQPRELALLDALLAAVSEDEVAYPWTADDATIVRVFGASETLHRTIRSSEVELEEVFAAWIAQRTARPGSDFDVRVAAGVLVAVRRVVVQEWVVSEGNVAVSSIAQLALENVQLTLE